MTPSAVRAIGLAGSVAYAGLITWLYVTRPQTFAEAGGRMAAAVGLYEIDRAQWGEGLRLFRSERYPEARLAFARADPAQRDAVVQFYVAYSFYRQGWGRLYNDDALFRQGLAALDRAVALRPDGRVEVGDPDLGLRDSDALRAELVRGTRVEAGDFNPLRIFRKRP